MFVEVTFYTVVFMLASLFALFLIYFSYKRRNEGHYKLFFFLSISVFCNLFFEGAELMFMPYYLKVFFASLSPLGFATIPVFWFLFVSTFLNIPKLHEKKYIALLFVIPVITIIGGLTNPWLHLMWTYVPTSFDYGAQLIYTRQTLAIINAIYNFILAFASLFVLLSQLFTKSKEFRYQLTWLMVCTLSAIIFSIIHYLNIVPVLNISAFGFLVSAFILYLTLFRYRGINFVPLIYETLMDNLDTGFLFFNKNNNLMDYNKEAGILNVNKKSINQNFKEVLKDFPQLIELYETNEKSVDLSLIPSSDGCFTTSTTDDSDVSLLLNSKNINQEIHSLEFHKITVLNGDSVYGILITFNDITEKVKMIHEKDMLLKEVNHRVKNNLQIILSLLSLDLRFNPDNPKATLEATRNRIQSMALLHEKIYNSSNSSSVNISDYLKDIVESLFDLYDSNIHFHYDIDEIELGLDETIPIGLIVIEFINNTIKYAFPDNEDNANVCLDFKINRTENKGILTIMDDGVGIPEDIDIFNTSSLGFMVINSLVDQIDGKLTKFDCDGACFKIELPLPDNLQ